VNFGPKQAASRFPNRHEVMPFQKKNKLMRPAAERLSPQGFTHFAPVIARLNCVAYSLTRTAGRARLHTGYLLL
jgi:hypothetical protein